MKLLVFLIGMLCTIYVLTAQETRVISGIINDPETGTPLPGVSIHIKGTTIGTISNLNGEYSIEVPVGQTLVFSYLGYGSEEVVVGPADNINTHNPSKVNSCCKTADEAPKVYKHSIPDGHGKTLSPYFFVKSSDPETDLLPLKETSANISIAGVVADVIIKQVYINEGKSTIEAVYIFPGSTKAAVYGMTMYIGDRKLDAKIKEKNEARTIYEKAKKAGKTAILLEQNRPNVFQTNVANILPGDTITVELRYTEMIDVIEGTYEFVYPSVVGPRYSTTSDDIINSSENWISNPYLNAKEKSTYPFNLSLKLKTAIPLNKVTCTSHKTICSYTGKHEVSVHLDPIELHSGNRDFIFNYQLEDEKIESGILIQKGEEENYFAMMIEPPKKIESEIITPREYIFIVDVSGSMHGFPLDISKKLIKTLIQNLKASDKFNVLAFAGGSKFLSSNSIHANSINKAKAFSFINAMNGGGGTELLPALKKAMSKFNDEQYSRTFIIATDGYVTVEREAFQLIRENLGQANLFAFGIGTSVNRYLIEGLAHAGMGEPFVITNETEALTEANRFIDMISSPVLTDIQIDWGDLEIFDVEPAQIPDIFASRPVLVYGKYKGNLDGHILVQGYSGTGYYSNSISLDTIVSEKNEAIKYLWARKKLKYLSDYAQYYEDDKPASSSYSKAIGPMIRNNIVSLGLKYNLLTEFTSFIAVDDRIRNQTGISKQVKQPIPLPEGTSNLAISGDINMSMSQDIVGLDEIVVVGYGTVKRSDLTGSVSSVSSESVVKIPPSSIAQAIQGKVSGVTVTQNSGSPGSSMSVRVRGVGSTTSPDPLYVVDGVIISASELNQINPNDIESIDVCKDASVSAIYGSSAGNGVILINTKKGITGTQQLSLSSSYSIDMPGKIPSRQNKYGQGLSINNPEELNMNSFSWGDKLHDTIPVYNNTFFKPGFTVQNYFSASMAQDYKSYYISAFDIEQKGIIPDSKHHQHGLNVKLMKKIHRKFMIEPSFRYSSFSSEFMKDNMYLSGIMYGILTTPPDYNNGTEESNLYLLPDGNQKSYDTLNANNPYWIIRNNSHQLKNKNMISCLNLQYDIFSGFKLKYNINYKVNENKRILKTSRGTALIPDGEFKSYSNRITGINNTLEAQYYKNLNNFQIQSNLKYSNKMVSRKAEFLEYSSEITDTDLAPDFDYDHILNRHSDILSSVININWKDLLLFSNKTGRTWSSTHGKKGLTSYSFSGAIRFSDFDFFCNTDIISNGKIRSSVSRNYIEVPVITNYNNYSSSIFKINDVVNYFTHNYRYQKTNIIPEKIKSFNIGLDIGLLNNRISATGDWYISKNTNVIASVQNDEEFMLINAGNTHTKGWEFEINFRYYRSQIRYDTKLSFTRFNTIVDEVDHNYNYISLAGFEDMSAVMIENQPYGVFYGGKYLRDPAGNKIIGNDGYPLVDPEKGIIGNPNPEFILGWNQEFDYRNLYLTILAEYKHKGDIWNGTRNTMNYFGTSSETGSLRGISNYIFDGVTSDGNVNTIPVDFANPVSDYNSNYWLRYGKTGVAEDAVEDGSYLKIREVKIGYIFPERIIRFCNMELYLYGRNLITLTHYSGIDPETTLNGTSNGTSIDYFNLPSSRSIGIGLELSY